MIAEQLKRSVLQAAIQGKLTQQLSEDGDARDLLKGIQKEKDRLIKEGKIKKEKPLPEITEDNKPFDIPENWCWVRLAVLSEPCEYPFADGPFGSNLKSEHYTKNREVRIIQLSNIGENGWREKNAKYTTFDHLKTIVRSEVKAGDIVIAKMMPAGRAIEVPSLENKYVLSSDAIKFVPNIMLNKQFILYTINSDVFRKQIYEEVHGITRIRTSLNKIKGYIIPLPPLTEQQRIVKRLEELLLEIDELKNAESKLDVLQRAFPKKMRDSVLQYAVEGKLTEQLPSDGDAQDLLKEIQKEKDRLIKEGKIKKEKPLRKISEDEIPFDIPENWCWARLESITSILGDGLHGTPKYTINGEYSFINGNNLNSGKIIVKDNTKKLTEAEYKKYQKNLDETSVLVSINGTIGNVAFYHGEKIVLGKSACYFNLLGNISKHYIKLLLNSTYFIEYAYDKATGSTIKNVSLQAMRDFPVPLPPLKEQNRIVERLEELLPEIDKLEMKAQTKVHTSLKQ